MGGKYDPVNADGNAFSKRSKKKSKSTTFGKGKSNRWQIREIIDSKSFEKGQNCQINHLLKSIMKG